MTRRLRFGYNVLRNGEVITELQAVESPIIRMDSTAEIKTTMSGTFRKNDKVNFLTDWIRPWIEINGKKTGKGTFSATTATEEYVNGIETVRIEAYDKAIILKQNAIETKIYIESGRKYTDVIKELLKINEIYEDEIEETVEVVQTDREDWEIGTSYIEIVNTLLGEINYNSISFDESGEPVAKRKKEPNVDEIYLEYRADEMSLIEEDCTKETDAYNSYNVFIAMVENPDYDEPIIATAVNDDPTNPLSVTARGRRVAAPIIKLNNIASRAELQEYVNSVRNKSMQTTEICTFSTAINPEHTIGDDIFISHPRIKGIYREQSWEIRLDGEDKMTHTAQKVRGA